MTEGIDGIVPVGHKPIIERYARAEGRLRLGLNSISAIREGREPNGSVHDTLDAMRTLDRIEKSFL